MSVTDEIPWREHQEFERTWWGDCTNTYGEETKQVTYAHRMGLVNEPHEGHWPVYAMAGKSVLDLGGGPVSMLLKTRGLGDGMVVDPCFYPNWVAERYRANRIEYVRAPAEGFAPLQFWDECWIYNVLQHVQDPATVIAVARRAAPLIRIFEWINMPPHLGHPHELHAPTLDALLEGQGTIEEMNENGCVGTAYYGAFPVRAF